MDLKKVEEETKRERKRLAREQLNRDLETIQKRATAKLDPFPDGAFERLRNNDVWRNILPFITDPVDIENAYFTCPTFQPDLYERRRRLTDLLPDVLRLLVDKKYLRSKDQKSALKDEHRAILKMRLISKRAKRAVEIEFFERPFTSEDWHLNGEGFHKNYDLRCCAFGSLLEVERTVEALGKGDSGHCFIRFLRIYYDPLVRFEERMERIDAILEFLVVHGHAVWGLCYWSGAEIFTEDNYEVLHEILSHLPNLKALSLRALYDPDTRDEEDIEDLHEFLNEDPFPIIPSLKYFVFDLDFYEPFIAHMLQRNGHIKTLHVLESVGEDNPIRPVPLQETFEILQEEGRLEDLRLERFEGPLCAWSVLDEAVWPLKALHLYLDRSYETRRRWFMDTELFPILNRFGNTLEDLSLEHHIRKDKSIARLCTQKLDLPRLKNLTLHRHEECRGDRILYVGLADWMGLKSLEKLKFKEWSSTLMNRLSQYFGAFPRLKQVEVGLFAVVYKRFDDLCLPPMPTNSTMTYAEAVKRNLN